MNTQTVSIAVEVEGIEKIESLTEKLERVGAILEAVEAIADKVFIECEYCGSTKILSLPCDKCGK